MKTIVSIVLILIGGWLGLASWLIWLGSVGVGQFYGGAGLALANLFIVGKLTTPMWLAGVAYEANHRWPWFGHLIQKMIVFVRFNFQTIIGITVWLAVVVLILWSAFQ